jgi:PhoH-like ATPase
MPVTKKKVFVLDTNVILHDHDCISNFQENDIVIPITVLEELDHFKKGNDLKNFQAREFTRQLDKLSGDKLFTNGVNLGKGRGKLFIETGKPFSTELKDSFQENIPDHRILAVAEFLSKKHKTRKVILVTKDINLRMKAKSLGLNAEDYTTDKVVNIDDIHKGITTVENIDPDVISKLYEEHEGVPVEEFENFKTTPLPNEYYVLKSHRSSALAHYSTKFEGFDRVIKQPYFGIEPRNAEQTFAMDALTRPEVLLVSLTGKAGTGKTLLALATALAQRKRFNQILLARPIVALSDKDLGFLPGDAEEKIRPYMQPLYDNLGVIRQSHSPTSKEHALIDEMLKNEKLVIEPLAYIRGRSLSKVFFIVDEAQNLTPHEVKTIITRAGEGTKIIFTGDIQQIDSPYLDTQSNGLSYLSDKMKGQDLFAHVNLIRGERSFLAELASNLL